MKDCVEITDPTSPGKTIFVKNNIVIAERYITHLKHRVARESWYMSDKKPRPNGLPNHTWYSTDGKKTKEGWIKNNRAHRNGDLPAVIKYTASGKIRKEKYFKDGHLHRDNHLPAMIWYDRSGKITKQAWFRNGEQYTPPIPVKIIKGELAKLRSLVDKTDVLAILDRIDFALKNCQ
jgi:hypothetical protein